MSAHGEADRRAAMAAADAQIDRWGAAVAGFARGLHPGRLPGLFVNPLAAKELLARMRGPRTFVIATLELLPLVALGAGLYATIASSTNDFSSSTPVGKLFFAAVTGLELGLICLLAPALTADLISGERERRTLDLLLVTPLSRAQIVVGKLVAALGSLLLLIVLALPIQAVAVFIGGVGIEELGAGLLILSLTAATYGCVGLYWSARLKTTRAALLFSYVSMLIGVGGLPALLVMAIVANGLFGAPSDDYLWPLAWLVAGASSPSARVGADAGSLLVQIESAVGLLLVASNPLLTGITSATALISGRPTIAVESIDTVEILYVAPWLVFAAGHLLAIIVLIWRTGRALGRGRA